MSDEVRDASSSLPRASEMSKSSWCRALVLKELDPETKQERDAVTVEGKVRCRLPLCSYSCCFTGRGYQVFEKHLQNAHGLVYTELWEKEWRELGKTPEEIEVLKLSSPCFTRRRKEPMNEAGDNESEAVLMTTTSLVKARETTTGQCNDGPPDAAEFVVPSPSTPTAPPQLQNLQRLTCLCGALFEKASLHRYMVHARSCSMLAVGYGRFLPCAEQPHPATAPRSANLSAPLGAAPDLGAAGASAPDLGAPLSAAGGISAALRLSLFPSGCLPSIASFTSVDLSGDDQWDPTNDLDDGKHQQGGTMLHQQGALDWLQARALATATNINDDDISDEEVAMETNSDDDGLRDPGVIRNGHFNRHAHIPPSEVHGLAVRSFPYVSRRVLDAIRRCEDRKMIFERQRYLASRSDSNNMDFGDNIDFKELTPFEYQPHQSMRNVFDHRSAFVFSSSEEDSDDDGEEPPLHRRRVESLGDVCGSVKLADLVAVSAASEGTSSCEVTQRRATKRTGFPELNVNAESDVLHYAMLLKSNRQKKELGPWLGMASDDKLVVDDEVTPLLPPLAKEVSDMAGSGPQIERKGGKLRGTVIGASSPLFPVDKDMSDSDDSTTKRKKRREEKKANALLAAATLVPAPAPRYHAPMLFAHHL